MSRWLALAVVGLLLTFSFPALGNHPEEEYDSLFAFDHQGGNEWWVEVRLVGFSADDAVRVQARDDDQRWQDLELRSWGNWAGSFHIDPEHRVRFRATMEDGTRVISCQFTHPGGQERCPDPGLKGASGRDRFAYFDHLHGNEWWVEVFVEVEAEEGFEVSDVFAYVEGDDTRHDLDRATWRTAEWGTWAGSFHIPPGSRVQFEAYQAGGMSDVWRERSCWFTHPDGRERCDGGSPDGVAVTYKGVQGNEWWVQVDPDASKRITGVDARLDDDGAWRALDEQDWGGWAKSFHVPDGSLVEFRTRSADGSWDLSHQGWRWTEANVFPPPGDFDVRFRNVQGNEWWVQVNPVANMPVRSVIAEEEPGHHESLHEQEWGDWAASFHVEPGHQVRFKAHTLGGEQVVSDWYTWPPG